MDGLIPAGPLVPGHGVDLPSARRGGRRAWHEPGHPEMSRISNPDSPCAVTGLDQMRIATHDEVHTSVLRNLLFADGFESGDTSQWSEEEP